MIVTNKSYFHAHLSVVGSRAERALEWSDEKRLREISRSDNEMNFSPETKPFSAAAAAAKVLMRNCKKIHLQE
jgi:hypothetical protein